MDSEEKSRFIQYLMERLRVMESQLEKSQAQNERNTELIGRMATEMSTMNKTQEAYKKEMLDKLDSMRKELVAALRKRDDAERKYAGLKEKYDRLLKRKLGTMR